MGYHIEIIQSNAFVPADKVSAACEALTKLMQPDRIAEAGNSNPHYKWIETQECLDLLRENDLIGFLESWFFFPEEAPNGNIHLGGYNSKAGDEGIMLRDLAPFIQPNTHIVWRGEEGEMWANVFTGREMLEKPVKIVW